ncbi:hypothetical protein RhiirA4_551469, partial [Rhizophagus irregularis]
MNQIFLAFIKFSHSFIKNYFFFFFFEMTDQRPIILWAHARSLSTVFERPFLQLRQEFHVIHEPFVPIGLAYQANNFEFLDNIQPPKPTDPITFAHHFTPTLNEILKPRYYNGDETKPLRAFVKDLA